MYERKGVLKKRRNWWWKEFKWWCECEKDIKNDEGVWIKNEWKWSNV
jgi:hypothetical protein